MHLPEAAPGAATDPFDTAEIAGRGGRDEQQDASGTARVRDCWCWVVADGLGGHRGGATAARLAVDAALGAFAAQPEATPAAVARGIAAAHEAIVAGQRADVSRGAMRATIVLLHASAREAVWGHVGDSRLYRLAGGVVRDRTRDHSVSQARADAGEIAHADQALDADRDRLFRALGQAGTLEPTICAAAAPLHDGDAFLLCSDGLWSLLSDLAIEIDLAATSSADDWVKRLARRATARQGPAADNASGIGVRVRRIGGVLPAPHSDRITSSSTPVPGEPRTRPARSRSSLGTLLAGSALAVVALGGILLHLWTPEPAPGGRSPDAPSAAASSPMTASDGGSAAAAPGSGSVQPAHAPQALAAGVILRVATGERFTSLAAALAAAAPGDEIWMGPGRYAVPDRPLREEVHLRGAGREATTLDAEGRTGLVLMADAGSLADLEICCGRQGPLLEIGGPFSGIVSRIRLRDGSHGGLRVRAPAAPTVESLAFSAIEGRRVIVDTGAAPVLHDVAGS